MKFSSSYISRIALVIIPQSLLSSLIIWAIASVGWSYPAPALFTAYWLCVSTVIFSLYDLISIRPYPFRLCILRNRGGAFKADEVPVDVSSIRSVRTVLGYIPAYRGIPVYVRFFEITLEKAILIGGAYTNRFNGLARITWLEIITRRFRTKPQDFRLYEFLRSKGMEEDKILPEKRILYKKLKA